jgi:hypothetical protein
MKVIKEARFLICVGVDVSKGKSTVSYYISVDVSDTSALIFYN